MHRVVGPVLQSSGSASHPCTVEGDVAKSTMDPGQGSGDPGCLDAVGPAGRRLLQGGGERGGGLVPADPSQQDNEVSQGAAKSGWPKVAASWSLTSAWPTPSPLLEMPPSGSCTAGASCTACRPPWPKSLSRRPAQCCARRRCPLGGRSRVHHFRGSRHRQLVLALLPPPRLGSVTVPSVAVLAGSVSTVLFAVSSLPMLIKAVRTKELNSYSRGNLVLANVANARAVAGTRSPAGCGSGARGPDGTRAAGAEVTGAEPRTSGSADGFGSTDWASVLPIGVVRAIGRLAARRSGQGERAAF